MVAINVEAQLTFNECPVDSQLIGRNKVTDSGTVIFSGEVDTTIIPYQSVTVEIFRNKKLHKIIQEPVDKSGQQVTFKIDIKIPAELARYDFKVYGRHLDCLTLQKEVNDIVVGDAYIIVGQSNAVAGMFSGTSNWHQSDFIRVFGSGHPDSTMLLANAKWEMGNGDLHVNSPGATGQWGLKLAKLLSDSLQIPIAIFNGAHGGKDIQFFQPTSNYKTSLESNYGRLYYRLEQSGLRDFVRGILWSQGEADGCCAGNLSKLTSDQYIARFDSLRTRWMIDYPNTEKIYIFQSKNGCGIFLHYIKEAQRRLAEAHSNVSIMPTAQMTHYIDGCHFPFVNGYEMFADRMFPVILEDIYGIPAVAEIRPPMITSATMTDSTTLVIATDAVSLVLDTVAEDFELHNADSAVITGINVSGNNITLQLSKFPGDSAGVSYLGHAKDPGNFIENTNGLELVGFYDYPIDESLVVSMSPSFARFNVFPNPSKNYVKVELPRHQGDATAVLTDPIGRVVWKEEVGRRFKVTLPEVRGVYNLSIFNEDGLLHSRKLLKE